MMERINRQLAWLDQRSLRERVMIFVAALVVLGGCGYVLFIEPQSAQRAGLEQQIGQLETAVATLNGQAEEVKARGEEDPDREQRFRRQQLQRELSSLDERLRALTVDLISPRDMAKVLRALLLRQKGMELISLENLPAEDLLPAPEGEQGPGNAEGINLYRHPVRIVLSGTYLQALEYLRSLEKLPRKLFWEDLEIAVEDYPRSEISLTVYTLSFRKGWIGA